MLWTAACLMALFAFGGLSANECDVLPGAKQFATPEWLPNDWYLNLPIGYRYAFNLPVGLALRFHDFLAVAMVGRMVTAVAFAAAAVALCRAFDVNLWLCLPWIYWFFGRQQLIASEWLIAGLDTKTFSYVAAIFALAALVRARYAAVAAWLGCALTFHLLVGLYACLCTATCFTLGAHWPALRKLHRWGWPLLITGCFGLFALASYVLGRGAVDPEIVQRGAEIYARFRVPHHVIPSSWPARPWREWLVAWTALFLLLRLRKDVRQRALGQYALSAAALFCVGLVLAELERITALRFYWFRFGDTMLPFLGWFACAGLVSEVQRWLKDSARVPVRVAAWLLWGAMVAASLGATLLSLSPYLVERPTRILGTDVRPRRLEVPEVRRSAMSRFIRERTPRDARFLIDPRWENFYVESERSPLVTFKHSPQAEADMVEWFERLRRLNGGRTPRGAGFGALRQIGDAFARLSPEQITALARDYQLTHLLTPAGRLPFPRLFRDRGLHLYRIDGQPP